ncbi:MULTISPECIES: homocysteine S-methyltransferase family protein [unclassified Aureimonas]|uniref:homocysteine S-methyltransferase family protein n=1 Tax=unclassified Aureimonas TaxID=2615206 RepID=UPI000701E12A|nr:MULTISPECIES: homocysteine S-methyltransferase family protein [unclassified Aureimonas]KQT64043.1 homocysteine methyltransferase [Aureimonas sp. Leaf427]KQT81236.1 homocysteine methyltransferase [Aureimonas sp. Leaf460]
MASQTFTLLDGGMGRLLERLGAPFRLPEWSALSLIEAPDFVEKAHLAYVESGAEIITTNSYGLVPHMIGEARFAAEGEALADRAGRIARDVADAAKRPVRVAGSLPPLFESYRPGQFRPEEAPRILDSLVAGLSPHVDLWLIETQSSIVEALTALAAVKGTGKPAYVSFTLKDEAGRTGPPELRSGETAEAAVKAALEAGAAGVLFNCSQPEVMSEAVIAARRVIDGSERPDAALGVYANAFLPEPPSDEPYAGISEIRADLDPASYLKWVRRWTGEGATIVGGCCGIGPEHIAAIAADRG